MLNNNGANGYTWVDSGCTIKPVAQLFLINAVDPVPGNLPGKLDPAICRIKVGSKRRFETRQFYLPRTDVGSL